MKTVKFIVATTLGSIGYFGCLYLLLADRGLVDPQRFL
jgi:hypothetical protein